MKEEIKFRPYVYSVIAEAKIASILSVLTHDQQVLYRSILLMKKEEMKALNPGWPESSLKMLDLYIPQD